MEEGDDDMDDSSFHIPLFSTIKKEENVFKLAKANSNEVKMTCFLLSCMKTIKKTIFYLSPDFLKKIDAPEG